MSKKLENVAAALVAYLEHQVESGNIGFAFDGDEVTLLPRGPEGREAVNENLDLLAQALTIAKPKARVLEPEAEAQRQREELADLALEREVAQEAVVAKKKAAAQQTVARKK